MRIGRKVKLKKKAAKMLGYDHPTFGIIVPMDIEDDLRLGDEVEKVRIYKDGLYYHERIHRKFLKKC